MSGETIVSGIIQQRSGSTSSFIRAGYPAYPFLDIRDFKIKVDVGEIILSYIPYVQGMTTPSGPRAVWAQTSPYYAGDTGSANLYPVFSAFLQFFYIVVNVSTGSFTITTVPNPLYVTGSGGGTPAPAPAAQYTKIFLGHNATITGAVVDLGGSSLKSLAAPVDAQDSATKSYVDTSVAAASTTAASALTTAKTDLTSAFQAADTTIAASVSAVNARVDAILAGSSVSTDSLAEVAALARALDAAESASLTSAVASLNMNIEAANASITAESDTRKSADDALRLASVVTSMVPFSAQIYADGEQPSPLPDALAATAPPGWYYRNSAAGKKCNWYVPCEDLTVADIKNFYACCQIINPLSMPSVAFYTVTKSTGNAASWYGARINYDIATQPAGGKMCLYTDFAPKTPGFVPTAWQFSSYFSKGTWTSTDKIQLISIGTNSAVTAAGQAEFVLSKVGICTSLGIRELCFSNSDVALAATIAALAAHSAQNTTAFATLTSQIAAEATTARAAESTLNTQVGALYQYFFGTSASVAPTR
jgi:hypothetical protein